MTEFQPWSTFDRLVDETAALHGRARAAAARSVDEILTLRSWLVGAWIVAFEQNGADRAAYGEGLLDALAAEFRRRGVLGLGASNLKNCRQLALTWPRLGIRQTVSGETAPVLPGLVRATSSVELVPLLPVRSDPLPWQDDAWHARLRQGLSFSHRIGSSLVDESPTRAYDMQPCAPAWILPTEAEVRVGLLGEKERVARRETTE